MTAKIPASAQGNVLRFSRVLAPPVPATKLVRFTNFLAPAAGADEIGDRDAVDEHRDQRRCRSPAACAASSSALGLEIPHQPPRLLPASSSSGEVRPHGSPVAAPDRSVESALRACRCAAALKSPPARPTIKLAARSNDGKHREHRKNPGQVEPELLHCPTPPHSANKASTNWSALNTARSLAFSPRPTNLTGMANRSRMGTITPPLAVPSSLARTMPVHLAAVENPCGLADGVLAGGGIEHQQRFVRRFGNQLAR